MEHLRAVAKADGVDQTILAREVAMAFSGLGADERELVTLGRRIVSRQPSVGTLWTLCARVLCAPDPAESAWDFVAELEADTTGARAFDPIAHGGTTSGLGQAPSGEPRSDTGPASVAVIGWPPLLAPALADRTDIEVMVVDAAGIGVRLATALEREGSLAHDVPSERLATAVAAAAMVVLEADAVGPTAALVAPGSYAAAAVARHAGVPVRLVVPVGRMLPVAHYDVAEDRSLRVDRPWSGLHERLPLDLVDEIARADGPHPTATVLRRPSDGPVAPELNKRIT